MKTLLRTAPDTSQDHTGQDPRPRLSASVTFANPLYPSINPGPAAARPAGPRPLEPWPARHGQQPPRNQTSSSPNVVGRGQRSESRDQKAEIRSPPASLLRPRSRCLVEVPGGGARWR